MAFIKSLFDKSVCSGAEVFKQADITTGAMQSAIKAWFDIYFMREDTKEQDPCLRLPYAIVHKLCKATFSEYSAEIVDAHESKKAAWQDKNLAALSAKKENVLQWALIGGECLIKPVPKSGCFSFSFNVIPRREYVVLSRDADGAITSIATAESSCVNGKHYTLWEKRTLGEDGRLTIENKLYESSSKDELGHSVSLSTLNRYAALLPIFTYKAILNSIGLVRIRLPMVNCVDGSPDGVSVYEPALKLIKNAYENERQLCDEFENGRSRVFASADLMRPGADGKKAIRDTLFTAIESPPGEGKITIFSPALRDGNYENRKQSYLRDCENLIGLKRGILSNVEAVERTATEITSSAGDYALTIQGLQSMWYDAVCDALSLCDSFGQMFKLCDDSAFDIESLSMKWGNGVLYDARQDWDDQMAMVAAGVLKPELALAWKYDLQCETDADLTAIREKYMPELGAMTGGE